MAGRHRPQAAAGTQLTVDADRYLERIGAQRPRAADIAALRDLHMRHLHTVPFENLSIHLGEPIALDPPALVDKIVNRRRGGFCYEVNGAFAELLRALGYEVELLAARVFLNADQLSAPFDHLALRVRTDDGAAWIADVGFGAFTAHPLNFEVEGVQHDPCGAFVVVPAPYGDVDVHQNGTPQYRLETRPRDMSEFVPTCWFHQTSPLSHFTQSTVCSRLTDRGRVTISGRLLIETIDGQRTERTLDSDTEIIDAYHAHFGIVLDTVPQAARST